LVSDDEREGGHYEEEEEEEEDELNSKMSGLSLVPASVPITNDVDGMMLQPLYVVVVYN